MISLWVLTPGRHPNLSKIGPAAEEDHGVDQNIFSANAVNLFTSNTFALKLNDPYIVEPEVKRDTRYWRVFKTKYESKVSIPVEWIVELVSSVTDSASTRN